MHGSSGSYGSPLDKHVRVIFHLVQIMIYAPNELTRICHDLIRPTCETVAREETRLNHGRKETRLIKGMAEGGRY